MENKKTTEIKTPDIQGNQVYWDNLADKIKKIDEDIGATTTISGVCVWFSGDWYNTETLQRDYNCTIKDENELIAVMNKMVKVPHYNLGKEKIVACVLPKRIEQNYSLPTKKLIALGYKKLCLMFGLDLAEDVLTPLISDELVTGDEYELIESKRSSPFQHDNFDEETYSLTFEYAYYVLETSDIDNGISFKFGATIDYDWERDSGSIDIHDPKDVAEIPSAIKCGKSENRITIEEYILRKIGLIENGSKQDEINGNEDDLLDKFHDLENDCMLWADDKAYKYDGREYYNNCWISSVEYK
jgi:hypothetical protein